MNKEIINICDKISSNEDISMKEFKTISSYLWKCNQWKSWNTDDVISEFFIDVRLNYDRDKQYKQKEIWIYSHIKRAIQKIAIFDTVGTLNNPAPVCIDSFEIEDTWLLPSDITQEKIEEFLMGKEWILKTQLEKDIYINCIKWDTPILYIAKEYGKSAEWWRIIKDRIIDKVKNYIENLGK